MPKSKEKLNLFKIISVFETSLQTSVSKQTKSMDIYNIHNYVCYADKRLQKLIFASLKITYIIFISLQADWKNATKYTKKNEKTFAFLKTPFVSFGLVHWLLF